MKREKSYLEDGILDLMESSILVKAGVYVIIGLAGLYILGHTFKITAHCIKGFKELRSAIK